MLQKNITTVVFFMSCSQLVEHWLVELKKVYKYIKYINIFYDIFVCTCLIFIVINH